MIVVAFTAVAAVTDFRTKRLPNWLTVPCFATGLVFHTALGAYHGGLGGAWQALLWSLGGFAVGFGILLGLWLIGGGGAGDVKLMGALGAWLGWKGTMYVFVISTCLVMVFAMLSLASQMIGRGMGFVRRRYLTPIDGSAKTSDEARVAMKTRRRLLPYGVPVALATWAVLAAQLVIFAHVTK
ncbi:MAG: prepilin peptidase [Planctomycetes bacterium]|nr:prepilin peptidase [Planctomycetota bacterium]